MYVILTRSLEENFVYLGSSLINFLTSFHELVNVTSPVSSNNSLKNIIYISVMLVQYDSVPK